MNERESRLVAERVIAPDLGDFDLIVLTQAARILDRAAGDVQMKRRAHSRQRRPLRQRFHVVDGFAGLDLDDALDLPSALKRRQNQIGIQRRAANGDTRGLLGPGVDGDGEAPFPASLQLADDAVVLELFPDGTDQNRAQE